MRNKITIGILAALLVVVSFLCWRQVASLSDEEISKNLPGKWIGSVSSDSLTFHQDGSFVGDYTDATGKFTHEGTIRVAGGYAIISVTKSSRTNPPVPYVHRYRIVRADARTIVFDDGEIIKKNT